MLCQLTEIQHVLSRRGCVHRFSNGGVRILRSIKRRVTWFIHRSTRDPNDSLDRGVLAPGSVAAVRPGDTVRVKSKTEIRKSLDADGRTRGCAFTHEMYRYCGRTFLVKKKVEVFFDEARQKMSRCHNMFILEDAVCGGRQRLYPVRCDRNCYFFWQIEWLDRTG